MPPVFMFLGALSGFLHGIWDSLPDPESYVFQTALPIRILDRNGVEIDKIIPLESRKSLVCLNDLPSYLPKAFIAIEDERFLSHFGIDFKRIGGAFLIDLQKGEFAHGASTITQQLVRNLFFSAEKTLERKIREAVMALRIEYKYTKQEILEMYLNTVFFGDSNYGLEAASQAYFSKSAKHLTLAQSASLAAMLKAPNSYHPIKNRQKLERRQKLVLLKMKELGFISQKELESSLADDLLVNPANNETETGSQAPYFTQEIRRILPQMLGKEAMNLGGFTVHTTLDIQVQAIADSVFQSASLFSQNPLTKEPDLQGAFIARMVQTGDILALIGGRDFNQYRYNRATLAKRQPGSCFKPFVYASAFESGILPNTIINDEPVSYYIASQNKEWAPENYGGVYHGPGILRTALEHSYNIVAIKLLEKTGIAPTIEIAHKMGIESFLQPNLTLALGSSELTPLELVSAYTCFANEGILVEPEYILKIEDRDGALIFSRQPKRTEAISAASAAIVFSMLMDVVKNGSGQKAKTKGVYLGGKTGTNQDYIDAWFTGVTRDLAAVATFGYNSRKSLGNKLPSSLVAAPVVGEFFRLVKEKLPQYLQESMSPPALPPDMEFKEICRISGLLATNGCQKTKELFKKNQIPQLLCPVHSLEKHSLFLDDH